MIENTHANSAQLDRPQQGVEADPFQNPGSNVVFSRQERFIAWQYWGPAWMIALACIAIGFWLAQFGFAIVASRSLTLLVWSLLALALMILFACTLGMFAAFFLLDDIVKWQVRRNGGPFLLGDCVVVIPGKYRGCVGRVTSIGRCESLRITLIGGQVEITGYGQHQLKRVLLSTVNTLPFD